MYRSLESSWQVSLHEGKVLIGVCLLRRSYEGRIGGQTLFTVWRSLWWSLEASSERDSERPVGPWVDPSCGWEASRLPCLGWVPPEQSEWHLFNFINAHHGFHIYLSRNYFLITNTICLSIVSDTLFSPETWGWPRQKSLQLSLPKHSLLANSILPPLSATFSYMYSFILSFHLTTGLSLILGPSILLPYTFFINSSFFLSIWPNHLNVFLFTHSTTPHFHYLHHTFFSHHISQIFDFYWLDHWYLFFIPQPCLTHISNCHYFFFFLVI